MPFTNRMVHSICRPNISEQTDVVLNNRHWLKTNYFVDKYLCATSARILDDQLNKSNYYNTVLQLEMKTFLTALIIILVGYSFTN